MTPDNLEKWIVNKVIKDLRHEFTAHAAYITWIETLSALGAERGLKPCETNQSHHYTYRLAEAGEDPEHIKSIFTLLFL